MNEDGLVRWLVLYFGQWCIAVWNLAMSRATFGGKNDDVLGVESVMVFITSPFSNWVMREVIYQSLDYNYRLIETAAPIKVQLDDPIEARRDLSRSWSAMLRVGSKFRTSMFFLIFPRVKSNSYRKINELFWTILTILPQLSPSFWNLIAAFL